MKSRDFCYWLMGIVEGCQPKAFTEDQTQCIKQHLNLVFKHEIDPSFGDDQEVLEQIHNPPTDPKNEEWREGQQQSPRRRSSSWDPGPKLTC